MSKSISVIVITYNRPEDTLALLKSIETQKELANHVGEILLLNNASTVSYELVTNYIEENKQIPITYFPHPENLGVAKGRNYLIQQAKCPYLLVLDDDVEFASDDAIQKVSQLFSKKQYIENNTAVLTLDIFYFDTKERQNSAFPHKRLKEYVGKDWFLTYTFIGAAHLMKKELFDKTRLYPEDFFYGMEEYDLSFRVIDNGYTLAYDNSVKVFHKESPVGRVPNKDKLAMMWYNKCVVAWRYLPNRYFYSTALLWTFEYLRKTRFDVKGAVRNIKKISKISRTIQKKQVSSASFQYLRKVKARLWF